MLTSVNNVSSRPRSENFILATKPAYVIHVDDDDDDDDDYPKTAIHSDSVKRRRPESPSTDSSKFRSVSHDDDDDSDVVIIGENPARERKIIQCHINYDTSFPSSSCQDQRVHNRLVKPEVHLACSTPRVDLDVGALRSQFLQSLSILIGPKVTVFNDIDNTSPPSNFRFINENVLGEDVKPVDAEWMVGCNCRKENGRSMGCEYLSCECVQQSDLDDKGRRHFPYSGAEYDYGCLRGVYLRLRNHIYECNDMCNCEANCKNRLVQHGRQIRLEIFKTKNRGWGLRCPQNLLKGQFIDTYRGEVITNKESNRRGLVRARDQSADNYLFGLDKFCEPQTFTRTEYEQMHADEKVQLKKILKTGEYKITKDGTNEKMYPNPKYEPPKYDIDSKDMGGPTRFINHSCDPNCAIYTVSRNHMDEHLYDVAFFTTEDITAGTELTFDYNDNEDKTKVTDAMADKMEKENDERPTKCLCNAKECRGYFFHS